MEKNTIQVVSLAEARKIILAGEGAAHEGKMRITNGTLEERVDCRLRISYAGCSLASLMQRAWESDKIDFANNRRGSDNAEFFREELGLPAEDPQGRCVVKVKGKEYTYRYHDLPKHVVQTTWAQVGIAPAAPRPREEVMEGMAADAEQLDAEALEATIARLQAIAAAKARKG